MLLVELLGHGLAAGAQVLPLHALVVDRVAHFLGLALVLAAPAFQVAHLVLHVFQLAARFDQLLLRFQTLLQLLFQLLLQFDARITVFAGLLFQLRLAFAQAGHLGFQPRQVLAQGVRLGARALGVHRQLVGVVAVLARLLAGLVQGHAGLVAARQ